MMRALNHHGLAATVTARPCKYCGYVAARMSDEGLPGQAAMAAG